jgi:branched-chain amino acid transport system permease protein
LERIAQQAVTGLSIGSIYALLAVGYALIFSIFNFSNFAFGSSMMVGAYAAFYALKMPGLPTWAALILALLTGAASSVIIERVTYRPLRLRNSPKLFLMITAIGVNLLLVQTVVVVIGGEYRALPLQSRMGVFSVGGVNIAVNDVLAAAVSGISLLALWAFLERTRFGRAIRACSYDMTTASLMGIPVDSVAFLVFAISGLLAAISGIFCAQKYSVSPNVGNISNKAFIASVVGGLGSLPGAVVGGVLLGFAETMISGFISSTYRDLFSYGLLVLALVFFPQGLFGKDVRESL